MYRKKYLFPFLLVLFATLGQSCHQDVIKAVGPNQNPFGNMLGINGFEWDFIDSTNHIDSQRYQLIHNSFDHFRHYLDWERIEPQPGEFRFNYHPRGGWSYDEIYAQCAKDSLTVLLTLQIAPSWLIETYPANERHRDLSLVPYNKSRTDPASYIDQAKAAFQITARYGRNKDIHPDLLQVKEEKENPQIGLGYLRYIECGNEPDKWWRGPSAQQSAEEYAANLSAFYDGHQGRLGKNVGVKNADPSMLVVMGGLAKPDPDYLEKIIQWCEKYRGKKADGSIDLCFDVINYHNYANENEKKALAPELSDLGKIGRQFMQFSQNQTSNLPVWVTETGYDLNQGSFQSAFPIGSKTVEEVQADWLLRTAFLYSRIGMQRVFFYMLNDVDRSSPVQYSSSGFLEKGKPRPAANYFSQTKQLLGNYHFIKSLSNNPVVDVYENQKKELLYVLLSPTQNGTETNYVLQSDNKNTALQYLLDPYGEKMKEKKLSRDGRAFVVHLSETPTFVKLSP